MNAIIQLEIQTRVEYLAAIGSDRPLSNKGHYVAIQGSNGEASHRPGSSHRSGNKSNSRTAIVYFYVPDSTKNGRRGQPAIFSITDSVGNINRLLGKSKIIAGRDEDPEIDLDSIVADIEEGEMIYFDLSPKTAFKPLAGYLRQNRRTSKEENRKRVREDRLMKQQAEFFDSISSYKPDEKAAVSLKLYVDARHLLGRKYLNKAEKGSITAEDLQHIAELRGVMQRAFREYTHAVVCQKVAEHGMKYQRAKGKPEPVRLGLKARRELIEELEQPRYDYVLDNMGIARALFTSRGYETRLHNDFRNIFATLEEKMTMLRNADSLELLDSDSHEESKLPFGFSQELETVLFTMMNSAKYLLRERYMKDFDERKAKPAEIGRMLALKNIADSVRDSMVIANIGLIFPMAKKHPEYKDKREFISACSTALTISADKFDGTKLFKFSTYACTNMLRSINRVKSDDASFAGKHPCPYDPLMERDESLDTKREEDAQFAAEELKKILGSGETGMIERDLLILSLRYGVSIPGIDTRKCGVEPGTALTLEAVGEIVGLTRERIRQIADEASEKLKLILTQRLESRS